MTELRVVIAGQESAGVQAVELAVERGHRVVAVLTDPDREPTSVSSVGAVSGRLGIPVRDASLVRDAGLAEWLQTESIDLLLNVHSLYVSHEAVVRAPRIGSFNLHPGPLPRYPGLNAPSWGLYEGEATFGCTVHWMDAGVDTGPIAYAASFPVAARETGLTLTARCVRAGLPLLARLLDDAAHGGPASIPRIRQEGMRVERGPGPPHDGRLPWSSRAECLAAFVRASDYGPFPSPWGSLRAALEGREVEITRASVETPDALARRAPPGEVIAVDEGDALVAAGEGSVLRVSRLRCEGRVAPAADLARPGTRFSA